MTSSNGKKPVTPKKVTVTTTPVPPAPRPAPKSAPLPVSELLPIGGGLGKLFDGLNKILGLFKKK